MEHVHAAVLDYAPPVPERSAARFARHAILVLVIASVFSAIGYVTQPTVFRASGYVAVNTATPNIDVMALVQSQQNHATGLRSPSNLATAAATLSPAVAAPPTPADIARRLEVSIVPDSRLIGISYSDKDPTTAAALANAVMTTYLATNPQVAMVVPPAVPTKPVRNSLFTSGGFAVGLLAGIALVAWRERQPDRG